MEMKRYAGIDLGQRFHQVAVVDGTGHQAVRSFRIGRGRRGMEQLVVGCGADGEDLTVSIEATGNYWNELVGALRQRGCEVYLISPKKGHDLRRFYALHTKTDVTDAEALARMPLIDRGLKPAWVAPPATATLLRLCRLRWKYRCEIANLKRRLSRYSDLVVPGIGAVMPLRYSRSARVFLRRYLSPARARRLGQRRLTAVLSNAAWGKFSDTKAEALWECVENAPDMGWSCEDVLLEANVQVDTLEAIEGQVERLDHRIAELYSEVDPQQRLMRLPGLGEYLSAAITAHIGDPRRFDTPKRLISYAGLDPRVKRTAGQSKPGQALSKSGSPFLRAWAYLGASNARRLDPCLKSYYDRLRARGKHYNTALCATAARLLERCHEMLLT
jgi:transposase